MQSAELAEKCGVFGIYSPGSEAARLVHPGLFALQHRGQESSGIATSDGLQLYLHKGMGLVTHVYNEEAIDDLPGFIGIGHNRYSTSQGSTLDHAQPVLPKDKILALAHNGNLPSTVLLESFLRDKGLPSANSNDSEMMADAIGYHMRRGSPLEDAVSDSYQLFTGAFSLIVMTPDKLVALRDPHGIRPLSLGKLNGGYVFASETCAFDVIHAKPIRDVKPGEMVVVDESGIRDYQITPGEQKLDIFEFVYFARPDSYLQGKRVYDIRKNFGRQLALEYPTHADVVIPIPDSAVPAAIGYSQESGIPFEEGLIKNRYIHRTFIAPSQRMRDQNVEMKLNPIREVIEGREVVIIDDSIVRGTTAPKIIKMMRESGAAKVHLRISSPPVRFPDYYGIDTPKQDQLIAANKSVGEIREWTGADSLYFLSYEGMIQATGLPEGTFSTSCFTGIYPIDIRERAGEIVRFPVPV